MRCDQFCDGSVSRRKASQQPVCHPLPSPGVSWRPAPGLTSLSPGRALLERRGLAPEKPPAGYPWVRITCCNQEPGATRRGFLERSWEPYSFLWVQTRDVSCFKCSLVQKLRHLICSGQRGTCSGRREDLGNRPCPPTFSLCRRLLIAGTLDAIWGGSGTGTRSGRLNVLLLAEAVQRGERQGTPAGRGEAGR